MILSMTGFGRNEVTRDGLEVRVEMRSVNNRFLEVSTRMPREFSAHENDVRELIRKVLSRGKINVNINVDRTSAGKVEFTVDDEVVQSYREALNQVRKAAKIKEGVNLSHILMFRDELIKSESSGGLSEEEEWKIVAEAVTGCVKDLEEMRKNEGRELARDLRTRIKNIDDLVQKAENISKERIPQERQRLRERIAQLFENDEIDEQRLELEIVLLADKLDVTEECVRYRSHSKYFHEAIKGKEPAGRRLNFLLQEMHREITTIGSKANDAEISHLVVEAKEELEKIREQVQNIE